MIAVNSLPKVDPTQRAVFNTSIDFCQFIYLFIFLFLLTQGEIIVFGVSKVGMMAAALFSGGQSKSKRRKKGGDRIL